MNIYLCFKIKKRLNPKKKKRNKLIIITVLIPLIAISLALCVAFFYPRVSWNNSFASGFFGVIFSSFSAILLMALLLLFFDLLKLFFDAKLAFRNAVYYVENMVFSIGVILFTILILGIFLWAHDFKVHRVEISITDLPISLENYRIVQLSDMHLGNWIEKHSFERAIDTVLDLHPDMIVFTGDLVDFRTEEALVFESFLKRLEAKDGIYVVLGNHDYGDYVKWKTQQEKQQNFDALCDFYNRIGWRLLRNEHIRIDREGAAIGLIGVENWSRKSRFPSYGDLAKATENMDTFAVEILLSHDPSLWETEVIKMYPDIDLTLSGHTHGFQFGIESKNGSFKWSPSQYLYPRWAGYYENDSTAQVLYVNRGLGVIAFPGRIGIKPEITFIQLKNKIQ
jgi:predicted MPP superfamily phosphohydrolase